MHFGKGFKDGSIQIRVEILFILGQGLYVALAVLELGTKSIILDDQ